MAYTTIAELGADAVEKGLNGIDRVSDDCISNEALRQIDSLGMIRLATTPTVTRRGLVEIGRAHV